MLKNVDEAQYNQFMQQWGMGKSRNKKEMKRRAESARMVTKRVGLPTKT